MKRKTEFVLGLISGILGILSCGLLIFKALMMPVANQMGNSVIAIGIIALLFQIAGLVCSLVVEKNPKLMGIIILCAGIADIPASLWSISADSPISFLLCAVTAILFIITGIIALVKKTDASSNLTQ